jgi:hypothetical protein
MEIIKEFAKPRFKISAGYYRFGFFSTAQGNGVELSN